MKYTFIEQHRDSILGMRKLCRLLGVSRSAYYDWRTRMPSARAVANEIMVLEILRVHELRRRVYGSPRMHAELRENGYACSRNRVARLMRSEGIRAKTKKKFNVTTARNAKDAVSPNLVRQQFVASAPNRLWTGDITYIWTKEGWLYLAVVLDVYGRRIVGYAMGSRITTELVHTAFVRAQRQRAIEPGMIFHSDRGCQYTSNEYRELLADHDVRSSMSGTGNCYDNAITEAFFQKLKTEHVYHEHFQSRTEAELSIFEYIEVFYNRQRRHSALGYLSPVQFENQLTVA